MFPTLLLSSIVSLLIGGCIYLLFRDPSLIFFGWIDDLGFLNEVKAWQLTTAPLKSVLPEWILFSLPDGLWLFSYVCLMLHLWRKSMPWPGLIWTLALPTLAVLFELIQSMVDTLGTFDWLDLLFYLMASIIPFVLFKKKINFKLNSILHL